MKQADYYDIAERNLPGAGLGGYALPEDVRFIIKRGEGGRLISVDGVEYVDYVCGAGATIIGHDHPAVLDAVRSKVGDGLHFFGTLNDVAVELSDILISAIPCADKIIFTSTGSEATSYAMRIARAVTGRDRILKFEGAYHGNHDYASFSQFPTAASNYPQASSDIGGVPEALERTMYVAPYNDLGVVESILSEHSSEIAAIMVEPVQRVIFPVDGFLQGLRDLADKYGVLLIFDEVVTGFRLAYGGAQEYFGVIPDLATYGKIIGGGGPVGCVAGRGDYIDACDPSRKGRADYAYINGTLHGNPIAAVAGMATLKELGRDGFYDDYRVLCDDFRAGIRGVLERVGLGCEIVGRESFWQFLSGGDVRNQVDVLGRDLGLSGGLDLHLLGGGIFVLPNVRRFFSAVHTRADLEKTVAVIESYKG